MSVIILNYQFHKNKLSANISTNQTGILYKLNRNIKSKTDEYTNFFMRHYVKTKKEASPRSPLLATIPMSRIICKNKQPHQKAYQTNNWAEIKT